ncbi:MAG: hypothetical protein REV35_01745 [Burkholderia sp.]|nr:hypothetical protein [Burkholderia sp.]
MFLLSACTDMLNKANGRYVIMLIDEAIYGALSSKLDTIVTAPV